MTSECHLAYTILLYYAVHIIPSISSLPSPHSSTNKNSNNNNHRLLIGFNQPIPTQTDTHFHWPPQHTSTECRAHGAFTVHSFRLLYLFSQKRMKRKKNIVANRNGTALHQPMHGAEIKKNTHLFVHTVPFTCLRSKTLQFQ